MWESDRKGAALVSIPFFFRGYRKKRFVYVLLLLLFIGLKLTGVIKWSWWWVLSPLWISVAIIILLTIWFISIQGRK